MLDQVSIALPTAQVLVEEAVFVGILACEANALVSDILYIYYTHHKHTHKLHVCVHIYIYR